MNRERRVAATSKLFKQGVGLILLRHEDDNLFAIDYVIAKNLKQSQELLIFFDNLSTGTDNIQATSQSWLMVRRL